ncbi:hypothetical protein COO72_11495 [Bifidobacterium callitrichos]|nr:hypothetical protein COO72_11495 [Bifidobacterium callitrichos]
MSSPQPTPQQPASPQPMPPIKHATQRNPFGENVRLPIWLTVLVPLMALLIGIGGGVAGSYLYTGPIVGKLKSDYAKETAYTQDLERQVTDLEASNSNLTNENAELSQKVQELAPNVDASASPIEVLDIKDGGSEVSGYRTLKFTVKNNSTTTLSNVFIDFSLEDASGNSVATGQAASNAVQLQPGATAVLESTVTEQDAAGHKVVPAQWTAYDRNMQSDSGNYDRSVKTLDLK